MSTKVYLISAKAGQGAETVSLYLREIDGSLLLTLNPIEAIAFKTIELAQEYYIKYVLPNILMGSEPLQVLDGIAEMAVEMQLTDVKKLPEREKTTVIRKEK